MSMNQRIIYAFVILCLYALRFSTLGFSEEVRGVYVFNNVPTFQINVLDQYGNVNFPRLAMDPAFGAGLGVDDIDLFRGGTIAALTAARIPVTNHDGKNRNYYKQHEELAANEQETYNRLFTNDEQIRLRNVSYRAFAVENGLPALFRLPAVRNAFGLNSDDANLLDEIFAKHQNQLRKMIREELEDGFRLLTLSMTPQRRSQILQLFDVEDSGNSSLPMRLLEGVLRADSPLQTQCPLDAKSRSLRSESLGNDLLYALLVQLNAESFVLSEAKIKKLYGADAKFALTDRLRDISQSNAHVVSVLDEAELRRLRATQWYRLLDEVHFTGFFVHPRVVSELAIAPSESEQLRDMSEKVALQVDAWLREVDTKLPDVPNFAKSGPINEFLGWYFDR